MRNAEVERLKKEGVLKPDPPYENSRIIVSYIPNEENLAMMRTPWGVLGKMVVTNIIKWRYRYIGLRKVLILLFLCCIPLGIWFMA